MDQLSLLKEKLPEVLTNTPNVELGVTAGMVAYCNGVHYQYYNMRKGIKALRKPIPLALSAVVFGTVALTALATDHLVRRPAEQDTLKCQDCCKTRGLIVGVVSGAVGSLGVTTVAAARYTKELSILQAFKASYKHNMTSFFATLCVSICAMIGFILADKYWKEQELKRVSEKEGDVPKKEE